ncbi:hypothetical protein [Pengzhenrongella sp.]|jgi:hypothetical protein|uniref:hypothetical protein n=1 Tax=Pengzhenrongella sp. TaxID=2888820 RepID=UPI002F94ABB9
MASRRTTPPTNQPISIIQRLREVAALEAAARDQRFDLVAQLRTEHEWSWQQIGAELGITKQGAVKVYAEHVQDLARRKTAADRARFDTVRPSAPVASPAVDVPLDLDDGDGAPGGAQPCGPEEVEPPTGEGSASW